MYEQDEFQNNHGTIPSQGEVNDYWNERFSMATSANNAWAQHETCAEWAYTTAQGAGKYNAILNPMFQPLGTDFTKRANRNDVQAGDIIAYQTAPLHVTYVSEVAVKPGTGECGEDPEYIPSELKWKWLSSGIYTYTPPLNREFDTPYNKGAIDVTKTLANQPWTEDLSYASSGDVYTKP